MQGVHVAYNGGMLDLLTGAFGTNTTTLKGIDDDGPYIWSNDTAGTATVSLTGPSTFWNYTCWGCIFKFMGTGFQTVYGFGSNTGIITNLAANIGFLQTGGTNDFITTAVPGHTYFLFQNNAVGTAALNRTLVYADLTSGWVRLVSQSSTGNLQTSPFVALKVISGAVTTNRFYAGFVTGAALPSAAPAATFYSTDKIMAGIADPWGLWYA